MVTCSVSELNSYRKVSLTPHISRACATIVAVKFSLEKGHYLRVLFDKQLTICIIFSNKILHGMSVIVVMMTRKVYVSINWQHECSASSAQYQAVVLSACECSASCSSPLRHQRTRHDIDGQHTTISRAETTTRSENRGDSRSTTYRKWKQRNRLCCSQQPITFEGSTDTFPKSDSISSPMQSEQCMFGSKNYKP